MKEDKTLLKRVQTAPLMDRIPLFLLILLLTVLPFNIGYHFNSSFAYVDGYFVNYLDFIVHIVDIAVVALTVWLLVVAKVWTDRRIAAVCGIIVVFWFVHNMLFLDMVVLYSSTRIVLYVLCGVALFGWTRSDKGKKSLGEKVLLGLTYGEVLVISAVFIAVIQAIFAIGQFSKGGMLGLSLIGESSIQVGGYSASSVYLPGGLRLRGYGTFPHPNVLAGYLTAVLILGVFKIPAMSVSWRYVLVTGLFVVFLGIIVTFSRVAWVVAFVVIAAGLVTWIYHRYERKKLVWFWIGVVVALVMGSIWVYLGQGGVSSALRERLITQSSMTDVSISQRRELLDRAADLIKESPFIGTGSGKFIVGLVDDPIIDEAGIRVMQPVHNVPVLVLAELGIVGVLCMGVIIVILIRKPALTARVLVAGLFVAAVGLVDHYLWTLPQGLGLVFILLLVGGKR